MVSNQVITDFMDLEEKNFLQKKKIFEILKLNGEIEVLLEKIANGIYMEEDE